MEAADAEDFGVGADRPGAARGDSELLGVAEEDNQVEGQDRDGVETT